MPQINRRDVLKGASTVTTGAILAGCGDSGTDGDGGDGGGDGDGDGGDGSDGGDGASITTLVYGSRDTPRTIDPHTMDPSNTSSFFALPENGYETLITFDPANDSSIIPALATEVPSEDNGLVDGNTIDFPLRNGVQFHTGGEMTASDVQFSWERAMEMDISPDAGQLSDNVESMEVVDDYTIRVTLNKSIVPIFLTAIVTRPVAAVVSQEAVENNGGVQAGQENQWMSTNSAGTGPFRSGELNPGNQFVWEPHEDYWGETNVDRVRQLSAPEASTRISLVQTGEAHGVLAQADQYHEVEGTPNINFTFSPSFDPTHITFNFDVPYDRDDLQQLTEGNDTVESGFFRDPDVRKGFAYAFDYQSLIDEVFAGFMDRMNVYHFPGMVGFDDSAPIYETDPGMAEEHFRAAGVWEEGFRVTSHNEVLPQFTNGNLVFKDSVESLNDRFTINVVEEPENSAVSRHQADPMGWPMEFHGFLPQGPDPDAYYRALMHQDGGIASRTYAHEHIDSRIPELIDEAQTETNQEERASIYSELQQLCFDDPVVLPLGVERRMRTHHECIDEVPFHPTWAADHFKHWDVSGCDF